MTKDRSQCCIQCDAGRTPVPANDAQPAIVSGATAITRRWSALICGTFRMGSADGSFVEDGEGPVRPVTLSPFAISCYAVSNLQFGDFVRATGYATDAERYGWSFVFEGLLPQEVRSSFTNRVRETPWWVPVPHAYWAQPEGPSSSVLDRLDHPVVHVSWHDARAYCTWSGTRLPTEAEWEMAARGGLEQARYPWGNELQPGGEHRCNIWQGSFPDSNTLSDGYFGTAPVHAFAPNGYGLHSASGNVWEWCEDFFSPSYHRLTPPRDPLNTEPAPNRSMRGGSFLCHDSYCNRYRVAARSCTTPDSSASNIGFRVARRAAAGNELG